MKLYLQARRLLRKEGAMPAKYPVVDPAPDMGKCTSNLSFGDYMTWFGLTAVSFPLGYAAGE